MINLGEWVAGDTGTKLVFLLKNPDGTAFDLTGASNAKFHGRSVDPSDAPLSVNAAIATPTTAGQLELLPVGTLVTLGTRARVDVQGCFSWDKGGLTFYSVGFFRFSIVAFP